MWVNTIWSRHLNYLSSEISLIVNPCSPIVSYFQQLLVYVCSTMQEMFRKHQVFRPATPQCKNRNNATFFCLFYFIVLDCCSVSFILVITRLRHGHRGYHTNDLMPIWKPWRIWMNVTPWLNDKKPKKQKTTTKPSKYVVDILYVCHWRR